MVALLSVPDEVDPKRGCYGSQKTIKYQLQQLPTELESGVTFSQEEYTDAFLPFDPRDPSDPRDLPSLPRPIVGRRNHRLATEPGSLTSVLSWTVDKLATRHSAHAYEFGYDENGYVCKLQAAPRSDSDIEIMEHAVSTYLPSLASSELCLLFIPFIGHVKLTLIKTS